MILSKQDLKAGISAYYPEAEIEKALKYYVSTQCQNIAPVLETDPDNPYIFVAKQPLIPFFTEKGFNTKTLEQNLYIVLAEAGMGKTTFMINLYFDYAKKIVETPYKLKFLPDFLSQEEIEAETEDEYPLPDTVRLIPLGFPQALEEVKKIPFEQRIKTILLLDAFDEDNQALADYKKRFCEILDTVKDFREVIITCRTQFFPPEEEDTDEVGKLQFEYENKEYSIHKIYVSAFDDKDIGKYLSKNYPWFSFLKRGRAEKIVRKSPNLMVRPMILSYIDDLMENRHQYNFTFQIYEEIISRWIEREVKRQHHTNREFYEQELYKFARAVAIDLFTNRKQRKGLFLETHELKPIAEQYGVKLSEIELKSRSLLTQNVKGHLKFAHKSILEYFIALEMFNNNGLLYSIHDPEEFELIDKLLIEMAYESCNRIDGTYKTFKVFEPQPFYNLKQKDMNEIRLVSLKSIKSSDLGILRGFKNLETLEIGGMQLNGKTLKEFLYENKLDLTQKDCSDISFLNELSHLKSLHLSNNQIRYMNPLRKLTNLEYLDLSNNQIDDIGALVNLENLKHLDLSNNRVINIYALGTMARLETLLLKNNHIVDITILKKLKHLKNVDLANNPTTAEMA